MSKPRPSCTITINSESGKRYKIDLFPKCVYLAKRVFDIKFADNTGETRSGSGTITKIIDRLRRLLVQEL